MLVGRVIDHEIHNDTNASLLGSVGELDEIAKGAVARIHAVVVGNVVSVVAIWGGLKRHQPNRGNAKSVQVVQAAHKPLEVTDPISVRIHEVADRKTVDHRVLIPKVIDHLGVSCI